MKSKKNVILIGMMGAGKSTIGRLISKKYNLKFVDIDKLIENETKMKISDLFEKKGEIFFRNLEEKTTLKVLNFKDTVVSLGGGGFINEKIRLEILKNHFSFWLKWNNKTLINRIKLSKKRPLAFNLSDNELNKLIKKRSKIYSKAIFKIYCQNLKKHEIVKKISDIYEAN
jgi:shikimate kinase